MTVLGRQREHIQRGVIVPAGVPLIGQEYFRIKDQSGRIWYWWISYDLAADWGIEPDKPFDQEVRLYIIPSWLKLRDSDGDVWYVYPEVTGSPLVEVAPPPIGEGVTNSPKLRVRGGKSRYRFQVVGGGLDVRSA